MACREFIVNLLFIRHPGRTQNGVVEPRSFNGISRPPKWLEGFTDNRMIPFAKFARNFIVNAQRKNEDQPFNAATCMAAITTLA